MRGGIPKDPALRQRRNRTVGAAVLDGDNPRRTRAPAMPKRDDGQALHRMTRAWWRSVWHSPMAAEYLDADIPALYRLAILIDDYWRKPSTILAAEIRQQQTHFGLTPLDRRRLQWEVEKVEAVKGRQRSPDLPRPVAPAEEVRSLLKVLQ